MIIYLFTFSTHFWRDRLHILAPNCFGLSMRRKTSTSTSRSRSVLVPIFVIVFAQQITNLIHRHTDVRTYIHTYIADFYRCSWAWKRPGQAAACLSPWSWFSTTFLCRPSVHSPRFCVCLLLCVVPACLQPGSFTTFVYFLKKIMKQPKCMLVFFSGSQGRVSFPNPHL